MNGSAPARLGAQSLLSSAVLESERARTTILDVPPGTWHRAAISAGFGTVVLHGALVALAVAIGEKHVEKVVALELVTQMVEVELPPELEQRAPPEQPGLPPSPAEARTAKTPRAAPPPAAAQAGQVFTGFDEVVDFGETFVAGMGASYAGGVTVAGGTATHAVRDTRARSGVVGGTGTQVRVDRSRAPQLAGASLWDCPFPIEADDAGVDHAVVTLRVEVAADGHVIKARAAVDPGHGFGREARRCAFSKRWTPGLDRAGDPTSAVAVVNVRFDR